MTTQPSDGPGASRAGRPPEAASDGRSDAIAVPLSFLLWALVTIALAYGVISTLSNVVKLFQ